MTREFSTIADDVSRFLFAGFGNSGIVPVRAYIEPRTNRHVGTTVLPLFVSRSKAIPRIKNVRVDVFAGSRGW